MLQMLHSGMMLPIVLLRLRVVPLELRPMTATTSDVSMVIVD